MLLYTVENGKIHRIICSEEIPEGEDWKKAPDNWNGTSGDKIDWFDKNMNRIPDEILVRQGKRIDKRGYWFNKETRTTKQIFNMDEAIDEDLWTNIMPLENEAYQIFDEKENKWIIDTDKKELAVKQNILGQLKSEVEDAERRQIRPMKLIIKNEATKDDTDIFDKYEAIIQRLRPEITKLEEELKSA